MSRPTFSILKTLGEACWLGARYWKILVLISLVTVIPVILASCIELYLAPNSSEEYIRSHPQEFSNQSLLLSVVTLVLSLFIFAISAMKTAAILGMLKESQAEIWLTIKDNIQNYTWTLIRVQILLALIAWIVVIPISMFVGFYGKELISPNNYFLKVLVIFFAILYLVFIKFALADPVVVVEGLRARASLKRSWQMTRGRFGYVLGCYVFLGTADYFLNTEFGNFSDTSLTVTIILNIVNELFSCLWVLLGWAMYQQIKAVEAEGR
jgi:magnesium-transporting ATPase (P-type)